jgi:hypothetical protein
MTQQKTRAQEMKELVESVMHQCPYAYNSKEYWIYNAGLFGTILARHAEADWILRQELEYRSAKD